METTKIAVFKGRQVRKTLHNNEWWFSIEDVVAVLTDSINPKDYINKMRRRDEELAQGWGQFVHTLLMDTTGGPQKVNCANTQGVFRIIQSIPSSRAEPFKRWLAKVGYERVQEIEDPELATKRTRALYKAKGYSDDWIEKRMRGIISSQLFASFCRMTCARSVSRWSASRVLPARSCRCAGWVSINSSFTVAMDILLILPRFIPSLT